LTSLLRVFCTFFVSVTAFYMMLWLVGALILPEATPVLVRLLLSLLAAVLAGRYFWSRATFSPEGPAGSIVKGALLVGGIGFCAGFFGPLIFAPEANQGPLLGILITGPLGFLLGAAGGFGYWWLRQRSA
jgi:hypothetical protein